MRETRKDQIVLRLKGLNICFELNGKQLEESDTGTGGSTMSSNPMTNSQQSHDASARKLNRAELQHSASSIQGREILVMRIEIPTGVESGWHMHPGEEVGYILVGTIEIIIQGQPTLILNTGDSFIIPPRTPHNALSRGPKTGQILSSYIVEIGQPLSTLTS
jgi:quercetin dioxygenase-like cupin family protein